MEARLRNNKFDLLLTLIPLTLAFGAVGGALQVTRLVGIVLFPLLLSHYRCAKPFINSYLVWILLFYIFCLVSLVWTPDRSEGVKELFYYFVHFAVFFEIIVFSKKANNALASISKGWLWAVSLTLIVALWEFTTDHHLSYAYDDSDLMMNAGGGMVVQRLFASVTFGNPNAYVTFLCFAFPFLLYGLLASSNVKNTIWSIVAIILTIVTLLLNASRGGILAMGIMGVIFLIMTPKSKHFNVLIIFFALLLGVVLYSYKDTIFLVIGLRAADGAMFSDDARSVIWTNALKAFWDTGGIGTGIGGMQKAMAEINKSGIHVTHNMMLEVLLQYGVMFFLVYLCFLVKLALWSLRIKDKPVKTTMMAALIAMPVYTIITSQYLLDPVLFISLSSLIVFANYGRFRQVR